MFVKERTSLGQWTPPWCRCQHERRYAWASQKAVGRTVLDAACANGYGAAVLGDHGASLVTAMDIAFAPLTELAPRNNVKMACGSVTNLPFADHCFDLIVSFETIEHVDDDGAYVAEMRRVLVPGGVLICSTPNRLVNNPGRALSDVPFNPFHVREYSPAEFQSLLRTQFPLVTLFGQTAYREAYVNLLAWIGRRIPLAAVRLHQLRKLAGIAFERPGRHEPQPLPFRGAEPEALVAIAAVE
jgi:SAM-dependent methyltransferase